MEKHFIIEISADGTATCPFCGEEGELVDKAYGSKRLMGFDIDRSHNRGYHAFYKKGRFYTRFEEWNR